MSLTNACLAFLLLLAATAAVVHGGRLHPDGGVNPIFRQLLGTRQDIGHDEPLPDHLKHIEPYRRKTLATSCGGDELKVISRCWGPFNLRTRAYTFTLINNCAYNIVNTLALWGCSNFYNQWPGGLTNNGTAACQQQPVLQYSTQPYCGTYGKCWALCKLVYNYGTNCNVQIPAGRSVSFNVAIPQNMPLGAQNMTFANGQKYSRNTLNAIGYNFPTLVGCDATGN